MTVYLVGAGPGDPGLLTVRGRELLELAEVVMYDSLAEASLLDLAPAHALRIDVGKRPGGPVHQDEINDLLVDYGRTRTTVVRLKGGDPFVLGRGGEEAEALIAAGIAFEVVPGVTSAIAVPAYAGVPVTHRGLSTSFSVVTGHSRHAIDTETNWEALAAGRGTIVVLMGVAHRAEVARRLITGGLAEDTPVAAIRWGTRPDQHTVRTTLGQLGATPMEPSVTIVIGAVAALDLTWFERRPLFGQRIVVTRARDQASTLVDLLRSQGAETIEVPTIETSDPADGGQALRAAARNLGRYDWVVLTSANVVDRLLVNVADSRAFGPARIAAVGPATGAALARYRLVPDLVPGQFVAEGLLEAMPDGPGRMLLPQAAAARDVLRSGLEAKGWHVDAVEAYRTVPVVPSEAVLARAREADAVTFTSSSTVTNFIAVAGLDHVPPVVACLGPITARTAEQAGLRVDVVAEVSTLPSLVDALARRLGA